MLYPYYYSKMFYDGLKSAGEEDVILLPRAAWPGSQRWGSAVWNGDIPSSWRALKQSVVSGLSMAVCGIPWWNSDIGGFHQGDTQSEAFRELIVRWFQFGLFCPVIRLHGARKKIADAPLRNPGIIEPTGGPNEIWRFGDRAYGIIEKLIYLRQRLRPYIHQQLEITSTTGMPLMQSGQTSREVYLPEGQWVLTMDGGVHEGGKIVIVHAELEDFIAFVPKGNPVLEDFEV